MSRYIVLRESGANELLLIDKHTQRVVVMPSETLGNGEFPAETANGTFKGIDMAVALTAQPDVASRMYYREDRAAA